MFDLADYCKKCCQLLLLNKKNSKTGAVSLTNIASFFGGGEDLKFTKENYAHIHGCGIKNIQFLHSRENKGPLLSMGQHFVQ